MSISSWSGATTEHDDVEAMRRGIPCRMGIADIHIISSLGSEFNRIAVLKEGLERGGVWLRRGGSGVRCGCSGPVDDSLARG
jgi:hypothetical protein